MSTFAARYTAPIIAPSGGTLTGFLVPLPSASVVIQRSGVDVACYSDRVKTVLAAAGTPVPTGVAEGAAGLDVNGDLVVYLEWGDGYTAEVTVGTVTTTVAIGGIPPDPLEPGLSGNAPSTADFLVGTSNGGLTNEIVVGPAPGGELGGTWPSPTVDATHSGTSHAGVITAHEGAADPHPGYLTPVEGNAAYDALGAAAAAQAAAVQRANHTGTQLASTISDLTEAAQDVAGAMATDSATIDFTYDDGAGTLTAIVKDSSLGVAKLSFDPATQAELDAAQAFAIQRANHTGTQTSSTISDFTEAAQDVVGATLTDTATLDLNYNDGAGTITGNVLDSPTTGGATAAQLRDRSTHTGTQLAATVSDFAEATQDVMGVALTDTATVDFVYNDAGGVITANVLDSPTVGGFTPANLRDRATHTGMQAESTITNLVADLAALANGGTLRPVHDEIIDYTAVLTDAGKRIRITAATAKVVTIPPNSSVAFPLYTILEVARGGAGSVTVAPGAGVTIEGSTVVPAQGAVIQLVQRLADTWMAVEVAPSGTFGPATVDYLVGTGSAGLSGEIVVGATPGGELGGTWAAPTVDTTHSGSSHSGVITAHEGAADPHPGYLTPAEGNATYVAIATLGLVAHPPTGIAATDHAMLDDLIGDAPNGTTILLGQSDDTPYALDGPLVIAKDLTVRTGGCVELYGSVDNETNGPGYDPWLSGTVLMQTLAGAHGLVLSGTGRQVNLPDGLGIRFEDAIRFTDTGHGIYAVPAALHGVGHESGLVNSTWGQVSVYGHDGDHYAFRLVNFIQCTLGPLRGHGGGGLSLECDSTDAVTSGSIYGNTLFRAPYFHLFVGGSAHGYLLKGIPRSPGPIGGLNIIVFERPQVNIYPAPARYSALSLPAPTDAQYLWKTEGGGDGTGVRDILVIAPDLEGFSDDNPIDFGVGTQVINGGSYLRPDPAFRRQKPKAGYPTLSFGVGAGSGTAGTGSIGTTYYDPDEEFIVDYSDENGIVTFTCGTFPYGADGGVVFQVTLAHGNGIGMVQLTPVGHGRNVLAAFYVHTVTKNSFTVWSGLGLTAGVTYQVGYTVTQ